MGSTTSKKKNFDKLDNVISHSIFCDCKLCTTSKYHKIKNPDCVTKKFENRDSPGMCNCANCQILKSTLHFSDNTCVAHGIIDHDCHSKKVELRSFSTRYYDYDNGCNCAECATNRKYVLVYNIKRNPSLYRIVYPNSVQRKQYTKLSGKLPTFSKNKGQTKSIIHNDNNDDSDDDIFE